MSNSASSEDAQVIIRSDAQGHWVEWSRDGETGLLGPYQESDVAESVRAAKVRELAENAGFIDDV
jgi:hypothetical protein